VRLRLLLLFLCLIICSQRAAAAQTGLQTKAEKTDYSETSRYEDVMQFISALQAESPNVKLETFAVTNEGRRLPLVILSNSLIKTPTEATATGKPIVFVMANIHAGEVEGKEATQHLMRDLVKGPLGSLLNRVIVLVAPIYNADGNERIAITNRTAQNGPLGGVGVRENAQGLDLNRDFMKMESPEARGLIENVFNRWDPHVVIDLHTTNGSYHGYALTYAPALNPNSDTRLVSFVRNRLLPDITKTLKQRHNYRAYYYGNFVDDTNPQRELMPDRSATPKAWATFDHRPRFGNNYIGLRNRIAILSEAYSYLDFKSRVDVTDKFVRSILEFVAAHSAEVAKLAREADSRANKTGYTTGNETGFGLSFELKRSQNPVEILVGSVTREIDSRTNRPRLKATTEARAVSMREYGEFQTTRRVKAPAAYLLMPDQQDAVRLIRAHGIIVKVLRERATLDVERYIIREVKRPERAFQGHKESRVTASTIPAREEFAAGTYIVPMNQPKAALIFYLLEPESDDGLVNWNFFDGQIDEAAKAGGSRAFPVIRLNSLRGLLRKLLR
jgi:hypothetical protein